MEVKFNGGSGRSYAYHHHVVPMIAMDGPANYLIVRKTDTGFSPLFAGECPNLAAEYQSEAMMHAWERAKSIYHATDILTHESSVDELERQREVQDLIRGLRPTMNSPKAA